MGARTALDQRIPLLIVATLVFAAPNCAASEWMSGSEIETAFSGVTIDGVYTSGLTFREQYLADRTLDYREPPNRHMTGRWSVVAGTFCTLYTVSGTGGCFRVRQVSANCFEFYFQSRTETEAAKSDTGRPRWSARGWNITKPGTCREAGVV